MVLLHRFARLGLPFGPAVTIAAACATLLTGALLLTGLATPLEKRLSDLWFDTSAAPVRHRPLQPAADDVERGVARRPGKRRVAAHRFRH